MPKELLLGIIIPRFSQDGLSKEDVKNFWQFEIYKLSCFLYTIAGIIKIFNGSKYNGICLMVQSLTSYMSDVHTLGTNSKWHAVDRYYALVMSIYHFYIIKSMRIIIINVLLAIIGFKYLKNGQKLYSLNDTNFLNEHTKWHFIAPIMTLF